MRCSRCNSQMRIPFHKNQDILYHPVYCLQCDTVFVADLKESKIIWSEGPDPPKIMKNKDKIPPLVEGTLVYICNVDHIFFLEQGVITDRSHDHYRVKLTGDAQVWFPEHWVRGLPQEVQKDNG